MFSTTFSHTSSTELDPSISNEDIIALLHDFGPIIHTNPDCKDYKKAEVDPKDATIPEGAVVYDCQDALTFVPKGFWDGGVWYKAIYLPLPDGCDITVKAPAGFTSYNKWRLTVDGEGSKSLSIESDATCNRTFAYLVQRFTPRSFERQLESFKKQLKERVSDTTGQGTQPAQ
ncbi:hypothetical protein CAC42_2571 [Sphaceloma murrayae]|uniref:DUF7053 domain-containing protein n=1 Tax=Sphaceloma murrayae TaxID=2082308 RepID=A0A2K1QWF8_9PEZI|nr:hypothetical protein CAC42_2571 [Sphaceloma murrayae]